MPPATRVAVIGADAAGTSAVHQALRGARVRGRDIEVVALERTPVYLVLGLRYPVPRRVADGVGAAGDGGPLRR